MDGEVKGRVGQTLKLTATAHEIEVRRSGYTPQKVTITPRPDFPQAVKVRLRSLQEPKAAGPSRLSVRGHELRLLAPGRFQLGASRREPGRRANETLREVELRRPSYLSLREVNNAQFRRFQAAHSSGQFSSRDLDADAQPVARVTWEQAAEYCNWPARQEAASAYACGRQLVATAPVGTGTPAHRGQWSRAARTRGSSSIPGASRRGAGSGNFGPVSAVDGVKSFQIARPWFQAEGGFRPTRWPSGPGQQRGSGFTTSAPSPRDAPWRRTLSAPPPETST